MRQRRLAVWARGAQARRGPPPISTVMIIAGLFCLLVGLPMYHWLGGDDEPQAASAPLPAPEPDLVTPAPMERPHARVAAVPATPKRGADRAKKAAQLKKAIQLKQAAHLKKIAEAKAAEAARQRALASRRAQNKRRLAVAKRGLSKGKYAVVERECGRILAMNPDHKAARQLKDTAALGRKLSAESERDIKKGLCRKTMQRLQAVKKFAPSDPENNKRIAYCRNGLPPTDHL